MNHGQCGNCTHIVIVGSGFAGLSAAIEAKKAGASVTVLEKRASCGGNSIASGGTLTVVGSRIQVREDITDSFECLTQDMLSAGKGSNDRALVEIVARESHPAFDWLINDLGVKFKDRVDQYGGHSVPRNHTPEALSGSVIIKMLLAEAKKLGVKVKTNMTLKRLLTYCDGGIAGIEILDDCRATTRLLVEGSVILATGGFAGDNAFARLQDPNLSKKLDNTNQPNTTAEALMEAIRIGAQCVSLEQIQLVPWTSPDEKGYGIAPLFGSYTVLAYGLVVDPTTGKRFINELANRKVWTDTLLNIGHPCVGIADLSAIQNSGVDIEPYLDQGVIRKFDNLDSLAAAYLIPAMELEKTIASYNNFVICHEDKEFGKPLRPQVKPLHPPYYAVRFWPKVHYTMGGLKIDTRARVLDKDDYPIPGLYAAGEVTGGIHGACRLGGCAMTDCLVFGRIAGREAALNA